MSSWFRAGHVYIFNSSFSLEKQSHSSHPAFTRPLRSSLGISTTWDRGFLLLPAGFFWAPGSCPPRSALLTWIVPRREIKEHVDTPSVRLQGVKALRVASAGARGATWTQGKPWARQTDGWSIVDVVTEQR